MYSIEISGEKFPLRFGYGAFRILSLKWDCKGPQSVIKKIMEIFPTDAKKDAEIGFDQGDQIGELVLACIQNAEPGREASLDLDEVVGQLMFDPAKLEYVITAFIENFPKTGNPQPQKPLGKKQKKKAQK